MDTDNAFNVHCVHVCQSKGTRKEPRSVCSWAFSKVPQMDQLLDKTLSFVLMPSALKTRAVNSELAAAIHA